MCGITKKELQQLCIVAKSIITQQPALFDAARTLRTSKVSSLDFAPYVRDYYTGAIIDTEKEKYYSAPDKEQSEEIAFPDHFKSLEKVAFHNLKIERKMDLILKAVQKSVLRIVILQALTVQYAFCHVGQLFLKTVDFLILTKWYFTKKKIGL